tara:strand:- start:728 stop:1117 length:390 start_codon:yes stop_codon:yes gene_type:complete
MSGISPKLPLERDEQDGFSLNKTVIEAVKQNLKMLVLTSPGERVMDPDFGCGIRRLLFEPATFDVKGQVESRIKSQVSRYLPFVNIIDVHFIDEGDPISSGAAVTIQIRYTVSTLSNVNILAISVSETT